MNAAANLPRVAEEDVNLDACERALADLLQQMQALEGDERRQALADWVRSPWFSPCGFVLEGWQGELHREAWRDHRADLESWTPGKVWNDADPKAGRSTIHRLLGIDGPRAFYASYPFRMVWTQEDEPWIGGAIGCAPLLDSDAFKRWEHVDIRHVILWNPKSGKTALLGDDNGADVILPEPLPDTLDVFVDTQAYFAAWARQRSAYASMMELHGLGESRDGHLPGALVIGRIDKVRLPLDVAELVAKPPLTAKSLQSAILRSAKLPRVGEAVRGHG